jgi:hypothetical protein
MTVSGDGLFSHINYAGVSDDPLRHFACATRTLHRAVKWYEYLVANDL